MAIKADQAIVLMVQANTVGGRQRTHRMAPVVVDLVVLFIFVVTMSTQLVLSGHKAEHAVHAQDGQDITPRPKLGRLALMVVL
jgi:hypothetical protein